MAVATFAAAAVYAAAALRVLREPFSPERLLEFRGRYRVVFAILLLVLGGLRVARASGLASAGENGAGD
jgi:hypothetical protein